MSNQWPKMLYRPDGVGGVEYRVFQAPESVELGWTDRRSALALSEAAPSNEDLIAINVAQTHEIAALRDQIAALKSLVNSEATEGGEDPQDPQDPQADRVKSRRSKKEA